MGGGAWPLLVGGAICLVNSVNERDLSLLTSYVEASLHGRLLRGTMAARPRKFEAITERPENAETSLSWAGILADFVPTDSVVMRLPRPVSLDCTHSFRISPNPARKVSRNIQLNSLLSPTRDGVCSKQCCNVKSKTTRNGYLALLRPKPSRRGHACLGVTNRRPHPLEDIGRKLVSRVTHALAKIRAKDARAP
ncbi:hypothetical protein Bca101_101777 [Brassica carinata]